MAAIMTDVMFDCETGGTNPEISPMIQMGAVKFNYATGEIGGMFDRALAPAYGRFWDESTREWWAKKPDTYAAICAKVEDPRLVMTDFHAWSTDGAPSGGYRFWCQPLSFDFPFVASYFRMYDLPNPYHYRYGRDLNTVIAMLAGGVEHKTMYHVPFSGTAHTALDDACHQIEMLYAAKGGRFS